MRKKFYLPLNGLTRRAVLFFAVTALLFSVALIRIAYIQNSALADAAGRQNTRKELISESRGYIYDRNMAPLVNTESYDKSAVIVCDKTNELISGIFKNDFHPSEGTVIFTDEKINAGSPLSADMTVIRRYPDRLLCPHIIGYLDSDGHGVCGVEKAFDDILSSAGGKLEISYSVDALGKVITGDGLKTLNSSYGSPAGVSLTIDSGIQEIVEHALDSSGIECGSVLVLDCRSFEILASASVPAYDVNNIAASLSDDRSPFIDRNYNAYPVGSVFKPFIAAAAMSSGDTLNDIYTCTGNILAGQQEYGCFNHTAHGGETLFEAIANSCNCYFIDCGLRTGKEAVISTCAKLGFGRETRLFPGLVSSAGNLPSPENISGKAQLANLCFGQGELLAAPLQIAAAYSVLANGGTYTEPYILRRLIGADGKPYAYYKSEYTEKVLDTDICRYIGDCLYNNMLSGTGMNGNPDNTTAAGKTATAQTGRYDNNSVEQLCTWFAGFFPYDKPLYTVVVFDEKGSTASLDCAPVFKEIAEKITDLTQGNQE